MSSSKNLEWMCFTCAEKNHQELWICSSCSSARRDSIAADKPTWAWACPRPDCGLLNLDIAQSCAGCDNRRHGTRFRRGQEAENAANVATARATYETSSIIETSPPVSEIGPTIFQDSSYPPSLSSPSALLSSTFHTRKPTALTSLRSPLPSEMMVQGTLRGLGLKRERIENDEGELVDDDGAKMVNNDFETLEQSDDEDDDIIPPCSKRKEEKRYRYEYFDDSEEKESIVIPKPKTQVLTFEELQALRASRLHSLLEKTSDIMSRLSSLITQHQNDIKLLREEAGKAEKAETSPLLSTSSELPTMVHTISSSTSPPPLSPPALLPQHSPSLASLSNVPPSQPSLLSGCKMHDYQIRGLAWLVSMYDADLNGILADEMGLGKTLQVLSLFAHLAEKRGIFGPHLIVVPLSVLSNWKNDAVKFAPLLATRMHLHHGLANERKAALLEFFKNVKRRSKLRIKQEVQNNNEIDIDGSDANMDDFISVDPRLGDLSIVVTTYEMAIRDESLLKRTKWQYCVVDEGHRLKNVQSRLGASLRALGVPRRLLLTGTPLQNNLQELWSLLNFCLPSLFNSSDNFEEWFAAPFDRKVMQSSLASGPLDAAQPIITLSLSDEERHAITTRLHEVLRPFFLRRLKSEVMKDLPTRTEKVIYCPMSALQAALYERTRAGLRQYIDPKSGSNGRIFTLSNLFMRLRQICNHPYLLADEWSVAPDLIRSSGKFEILHRLLPKLVIAGRRILLFSQMTSVLDLIEDLVSMLNLSFVRLDGQTKPSERSQLIDEFNAKDSIHSLFLLSTRAGGVGVNLHSADTVIIFDSDWNPQMDLQAMSRAHRLGQTKDVHVIRLISNGPLILSTDHNKKKSKLKEEHLVKTVRSVEMVMHERAQQKLETEAAVIGAGRFHHGSVTCQNDDLECNGHRTTELVQACLSDVAIEQEELITNVATFSPKKESSTSFSLSTLSHPSSSLQSSPLSSPTSFVSAKEDHLQNLDRVVYSSLSTAMLNFQCSRDASDLLAFEEWDAHLDKMLETEARNIFSQGNLDDLSAIEEFEKKRYFINVTLLPNSTMESPSSFESDNQSSLPVLAKLFSASPPIPSVSPLRRSLKGLQQEGHPSQQLPSQSSPLASGRSAKNSLVSLANLTRDKSDDRRLSGLGTRMISSRPLKKEWRSLLRSSLMQRNELPKELIDFL